MNKDSSYQQLADLVRDYFLDREEAAAVYLFGSAVSGRLAPASDIDIGVLYNPSRQVDIQQHAEDALRLSGLLGREVDLVPLLDASPVLRYQVLKHGELILTHDQKAVSLFFVRTLNEYFDLKANRRVIEARLKEARIA